MKSTIGNRGNMGEVTSLLKLKLLESAFTLVGTLLLAIGFGMMLLGGGCTSPGGQNTSISGFLAAPDAQTVQRHVVSAKNDRLVLWSGLKNDQLLIGDEQYLALKGLNNRATMLAAQIEVGLEQGTMPPVSEVKTWLIEGQELYEGVSNVLTPILDDLSPTTRSAWAIEQVRLRTLRDAGQAYLASPNTETYKDLAEIGFAVVGSVLSVVLL